MKGILYGIGVGIGTSSGLSINALETIKKCDVIFFPNKSRADCRAYQIVNSYLNELETKKLCFCDFPMTKDEKSLAQAWEKCAGMICEDLKEKNVAFLTIGDPSLYSTFFYIKELVEKNGFKSQIIAGIPSFCAVAAKLGMSLALENEQIHIIPDTDNLEKDFFLSGTLVFMKSGKNLSKLKDFLISHKNQIKEFGAVSNCGFEDEKIMLSPEELDEKLYLTVVIVKKND